MKKTIYCYIGVCGSGKNYKASMKSKELGGCKILDPSDGVREYAFAFLGIDPSKVHYDHWKSKAMSIPVKAEFQQFITGREYLEKMATKLRSYNEDIWAEILGWKVQEELRTGKSLVVNSVRYLNEAAEVISNATLYGVGYNVKFIFCDYHSPRYEIRDHESEYLAQKILGLGYKDGEDVTNCIMKLLVEDGLL